MLFAVRVTLLQLHAAPCERLTHLIGSLTCAAGERKVGGSVNNPGPSPIVRRSLGAIIATIGFLLSPLSWWNDLLVNVPLALGFAWAISWFWPPAFATSFVLGYWLTNVAGLMLMQWGGASLFRKEGSVYSKKKLLWDLFMALLYTALIVLLVNLGVFAPLPDYLGIHR